MAHLLQLAELTPVERELYEERAGIKQYMGHINRVDAERQALQEIAEARLKQRLLFQATGRD